MINSINLPDGLKNLSVKELETICSEIRELLINTVSKCGGHLAPSLGVVELTVALHSLLDSPKDKIIWDVGHQAYAHKILTGRKDKLDTIRQFGGISGFPKREESEHDIFGTGHASTSISAALGVAKARDIKGEDYAVFSVIGDGSMSGGLAFEAINNASEMKGNFTVILNDNGMSISSPVGAMSDALTAVRTSSTYLGVKQAVEGMINKIPSIGTPLVKKIEKLVDRTKNLITDFKVGVLFEEFGFRYIGPIDGHNLPMLMMAISYAKRAKEPILIHVITKKGKGYFPAEQNPEQFHGISPFCVESGKVEKSNKKPSYTESFSKAICQLAATDKNICAITAAMPGGTGLGLFKEKYPERFFDVGIAEEHAVVFAAGLATQGLTPYVAIYSTFLQRAYDQIIHDVCLQKLPVKFMLDRSGVVGEDGPTHHGLFDLSYLRHIPGLCVMAPKDQNELFDMAYAANSIKSPVAIRFPRGAGLNTEIKSIPDEIEFGKAEVVFASIKRNDKKLCFIPVGDMVTVTIEVAKQLVFYGYDVVVINPRFIKPFDVETVVKNIINSDLLVTVEDNVLMGGFGSLVLEELSDKNLIYPLLRLGFPDEFIEHGDKASLFSKYNLDQNGILNSVLLKLGVNEKERSIHLA